MRRGIPAAAHITDAMLENTSYVETQIPRCHSSAVKHPTAKKSLPTT